MTEWDLWCEAVVHELTFHHLWWQIFLCEMEVSHLESVESAVVLHEEVFLLADGEVVPELAQQVCKVDRLNC